LKSTIIFYPFHFTNSYTRIAEFKYSTTALLNLTKSVIAWIRLKKFLLYINQPNYFTCLYYYNLNQVWNCPKIQHLRLILKSNIESADHKIRSWLYIFIYLISIGKSIADGHVEFSFTVNSTKCGPNCSFCTSIVSISIIRYISVDFAWLRLKQTVNTDTFIPIHTLISQSHNNNIYRGRPIKYGTDWRIAQCEIEFFNVPTHRP
jgi:hypothetical protein